MTGEITDITPGERPVVTLADGTVHEGERAVVAMGVWSRALAEKLGLKTPLESERGYHVQFTGANRTPPFPYMVAEAKFAFTPMAAGPRAAGVVEFGGTGAAPSQAPVDLLKRSVARVYPDMTFKAAEDWMGHRPSTPDSLPMLGEAAPGVITAFGAQHIGLTMGARVGRMVADIAARRGTNADLAPFDPHRFS